MKSTIRISNYSGISKRGISIPGHVSSQPLEPDSIVITNSHRTQGLRQRCVPSKNDVPARRAWHELHLAIDKRYQNIACELTTPDVGDRSAKADLLVQIVTPF